MHPSEVDRSRIKMLRIIFWLVAIVLGAIHAWTSRFVMIQDGLSYLDIGDAYFRGDWDTAINAYWSPFYSWLLGLANFVLKPSPYWESFVAHVVNFEIYLCALGSFEFFLRELIRYNQKQALTSSGRVTLPEWSWLVLGYTLFIWSSLVLTPISVLIPDLCTAVFVYLAAGILLRIRMRPASWLTFTLLGLVLGFGYLTKTAMFPLAFIFLCVGIFSVGNLQRALLRGLIALFVFILIGSPFIIAISMAKGRITIGDSGKINYARFVNKIIMPVHWQGDPPSSGIPKHPTRKIFDQPAVYEFATPIGGTYPPWYDPSYWYEGAALHFDLREQMRLRVLSPGTFHVKFLGPMVGLIVASFILFYRGRKGWLCLKDIAKNWHLLIPAIAALCMYLLVVVEWRYIGAFIVLLWLGIFSGVHLPDSRETKRLLAGAIVFVSLVMIIANCALLVKRILIDEKASSTHVHWQIAEGLNQMGVQPGDKVTTIGFFLDAYWARLARVKIVAEIGREDSNDFWNTEQSIKTRVIDAFAKTGAKVIVAANVPSHASTIGWQRIENTNYYTYFLQR